MAAFSAVSCSNLLAPVCATGVDGGKGYVSTYVLIYSALQLVQGWTTWLAKHDLL